MATTPPTRRGRSLLILLAGALVGALVLLLVPGPRPAGPAAGDAAFAREVAAAVGPLEGFATVSAARVRGGEVTWAGFGPVSPDSRYELGSITKTFNGLLLADAVARGEVRLDDPVATHLPELAGSPAGTATLAELATHHSGLPALGAVDWPQLVAEDLAGRALTAYTASTTTTLLADARAATLGTRGRFAYSNLGAALLGHALARAAGASDWPTLLRARILEPLDLRDTRVDAARPAPDLQQPHQPDGRPTAPWVGEGYAPAGLGVTTTAADLARYATALPEGRAPGMAALEPRADAMPGLRIGLAWVVAGSDADPVVWHNGGTGGTRTMLALDRGTGEATLVLTNTARDVTGAGLVLLGAEPGSVPPPPPFDADTIGWVAGGIVTTLLFACGAVVGRSRIRIGGQGLAALGGLVMWLVAAPWDWAPPWVFGLFAGLAVAAAVVAGLRWHTLPRVPHRWRPVAYVVAALGVLWFVAMLAMAGWVLALSLA